MLFFPAILIGEENKSAVFEKNKTEILNQKASVYNSYVFGVGKISSNTKNRNVGLDQAKIAALANLSYYIGTKVDWPDAISRELREKIWTEYLKCVTFDFSVKKDELLFQASDKNNYIAVIGIPEKDIIAVIPVFDVIRRTLLTKANYDSGKIRISVCLELCDQDSQEEILTAYSKKMQQEYGVNVANIILGKNALSFLCRDDIDLSKYPIHELLTMLEKSPYDPEICYYIGIQMEQDGLLRNAHLFWERGCTASLYDSVYSQKCLSKIKNTKTVKNYPVLSEMLFLPASGNVNFDNPYLEFLNYYAGMLPVGSAEEPVDNAFSVGQSAFANNQLETAYSSYLNSVANKITFQACNMAGNAGRRIGREYESIALLLQATAIDPQAVYPWIHLAWIYHNLNLAPQKEFCIEKIKSYKLDQWSSQQLDLLTDSNKN